MAATAQAMPHTQATAAILKWFDHHGRKDLPWQHNTSAYRVWVSEIMLQQTQVATVIPYYQRFMQRFPNVKSLALAPVDDVLHLWTGLGCYARARNLHKTAIVVHEQLRGRFPRSVEELEELPGIGRSTAGAIHSIANKQYAVILDGNVKRVLSRLHCIDGWYGTSSVAKQLWQLAQRYTPKKRTADYTQAIMDLGATVCTRSKPQCESCPVSKHCEALASGKVSAYPQGKPRKKLPIKKTQMLLLQNSNNEIWLYKRPSQGIWGGLWSLPEISVDENAQDYAETTLELTVNSVQTLANWRHTFSHFHLDIQAVLLNVGASSNKIMEDQQQLWYNSAQPAAIGLAAPVKRLLNKLDSTKEPA